METRNYINGRFIDSSSKRKLHVINPADQSKVGFVDEALDDEIDLAFDAASKAFKSRVLQDMDAVVKSNLMRLIASKLREYKTYGSKLLSKENGKSIEQCAGEFEGAVFGVGIIAYMEVGVVAVGMSGTWRQFFNGLIILLALLGHRLHGDRVR